MKAGKTPAGKPLTRGTDRTRTLLLRGKTAFFREEVFAPTFRILSGILSGSEGRKKLLVIGCSTGEEPYSLAMALTDKRLNGRISMLAIDKDPQILAYAARGIYDLSTYNDYQIPPFAKGFFDIKAFEGENFYIIKKKIKSQVEFRLNDITSNEFPKRTKIQDVIILNYVWNHLDSSGKLAAAQNIKESLNPDGFLITDGEIEAIHPSFKLVGQDGMIRKYRIA